MNRTLLLLALGCSPSTPTVSEADADTDTDTDADADTDTDADSDTDLVLEGSVAIISEPDGQTSFRALFTSQGPEVVNIAECFGDAGLCRSAFVAPGDILLGYPPIDTMDLSVEAVGEPVTVGGITGGLLNSLAYQNLLPGPPTTPVVVTWEERFIWPAFDAEVVQPVAPLGFSGPDTLVLPATGSVPLRWTAGDGGIELVVTTVDPGGARWRHVFGLDDDGEHDLDLGILGLNAFNRKLELELSRVAHGEVPVGRHTLAWTNRSRAPLDVWLEDASRIALPTEVCPTTPLGPGSYRGRFSAGTSNHNPGDGSCVGFPTPGPEILVPVTLQPGEQLFARFEVLDGYGKIYVLDSCTVGATCLAGADAINVSGPIDLVYLHTGSEPRTVMVVLDSDQDADLFHLDLDLAAGVSLDTLADTCVQSTAAVPFTESAQLVGTLEGFAADVVPIFGGCGFNSWDGPDALVPIELAPGQRARVHATGPVGLHASTTCDDPNTCSGSVFMGEDLTLANTGSTSVVHHVAVDSYAVYGAPQSFLLDVQIYTPGLTSPVNTCASLDSAPYLGTGTYHLAGDIGGFTNDLDLLDPGPSCTGFTSRGQDGLMKVRLEAGERITVDYVRHGGDGVVYLLETCTDTSTAVMCDDNTFSVPGTDAPEHFTYRNPNATGVDYVLVLDTWTQGSIEAPFSLDLVIE